MNPKRESVRGAGRDTAGATSVTMQIWYELVQAGEDGLVFDEILEKVSPRVSLGYAWRRYNRHRRTSGSSVADHRATLLEDSPANRRRSVLYIVRDSLSNMKRDGTVLKRPDGRYARGVRKPKSAFTDEQHDFDGSVSRRLVANMQLLRILTEPDGVIQRIETSRRNGKKQLPTISTKLAAALEQWASAYATSQS